MPSQIRDVVLRSPVTAAPHDTIDCAESRLIAAQGSDVYVIDDHERLLGVVPDYEFLKHRLRDGAGTDAVGTLMTPVSVTLPAESELHAAALLLRESIRATLPVVERGRLVGQLCRIHLLRILGEQARQTASATAEITRQINAALTASQNPLHQPAQPHFLKSGQSRQALTIAGLDSEEEPFADSE